MNILFKRSVQRIILLAISFLIQVAIIIFFLLQYSEYFFNFYIASLALSIVIVFIITNSKSNPSYKIAWIIPVMIFPVFGGLFYLLYGGNKLSAREKLKMAIQNIEMTHSLKQNDKIMQKLQEDNIDVKYVFEDKKEATGIAFIMVNENGNNSIIVVSGANMTIDEYEIESSVEKIKESDILIAQFETAEEMTLKAFKRAKEFGKVTILNPAPAKEINEEFLKVTDIIVPNETEAEVLTGVTIET